MKIILIFAACCLALALALPDGRKFDKVCRDELGISDVDKPFIQLATENDCFKACVYRKAKYMNADGSMDIEFMIVAQDTPTDAVAQRRKTMTELNEKCQNEAGGDACRFAKCMYDANKH